MSGGRVLADPLALRPPGLRAGRVPRHRGASETPAWWRGWTAHQSHTPSGSRRPRGARPEPLRVRVAAGGQAGTAQNVCWAKIKAAAPTKATSSDTASPGLAMPR